MIALLFLGAVLFLALGHLCKAMRWRRFVGIYENTPLPVLISSLAAGYLINFYVPFHLGDLARVWLAGRKMENRYGYAASTIIVDRCLDVLAVALFFSVMALCVPSAALKRAALSFLLLLVLLTALLVVALVCNRACKQAALGVCSLFNQRIKFRLLFFLWSLISSFKDVFQKVAKGYLLLETLAMWTCYLLSYGFIAAMLRQLDYATGLTDIFLMMFNTETLGQSTFALTSGLFGTKAELLLCAYILAPLPLLLLAALPASRRAGKRPRRTTQLLPQLKPEEQLQFLSLYFEGKNRRPIQAYLEMNRDVGILRDYSSGSDATTMLCIKQNETVFRKYAFGAAAVKLEEQALWLRRNAGRLPLAEICDEKRSELAYCYDMRYDAAGIGMFQYIHSRPAEESWQVLQTVLEDLRTNLYPARGELAEESAVSDYIDSKVTANLERICQSRTLRALTLPPYLTINGVRCRNLPLLRPLLEKAHLLEVFSEDTISEVHGDLTVENIICYAGGVHAKPYYLIDPNPSNPVKTPNLDYAKLLQSLHGRYEFLDLSPTLTVEGANVEFLLPDSSQYRELYALFYDWLCRTFDRRTVRSIFYHEIIHWLRLLPYRLRRNEATAPRYYAGLILVMNDVATLFEGDCHERTPGPV